MKVSEDKARIIKLELNLKEAGRLYLALTGHEQSEEIEADIVESLGMLLTKTDIEMSTD